MSDQERSPETTPDDTVVPTPPDGTTPDGARAGQTVPADVVPGEAPSADTPAPEDAPAKDIPAEDAAEAAPAEESPAQDAPGGAESATEPAPEPVVAPVPAPEPAAAPPAVPGLGPKPRPVPRPPGAGITPAAIAPKISPSAPPPPPDLTPAEAEEAARWGRVDDDGTVWVREATGERTVGQYPGADTADALAFYVRRYADLHAKVLLFESRLNATDLAVKEIDTTLAGLTEELAEPAAVGDLDALRGRLDTLREVAAQRRATAEAERAAAREAAVVARTEIVEAAEKIAGTDPSRMQWRPSGDQLRTLLDRWKEAQRHGPRIDRTTEDALWKRFSHARSSFDRERRRYFSELEKHNSDAKTTKSALVAEAERLSTSTDWATTSAAFRDLMTRWKAAGRASRKDDDALWAKFRAAQDAFFAARDEHYKQTDEEFRANLEVKLAILEQAEQLVPVSDVKNARAALRDLQDRWEAAGKVPRGDLQRVEGRMRAVEQAVRDAEQQQWKRSNPETRARAEGAATQLVAAIAGLEADLEAARAAGDQRKVAEAQAALDARRSWLEQVERAAADSRS